MHEVYMADFLTKKMNKELPHSNHPPLLQAKVDSGKHIEWETIISKPHAVKVHHGKKAAQIKAEYPDRFIGSRFILTRKPVSEGLEVNPHDWNSFSVKGRWCSKGHLDPYLSEKASEGMFKSPTLSQLGRMTLMQLISSMRCDLYLVMSVVPFLKQAQWTPGSDHCLPTSLREEFGLPPDAVIEVCGNVYGQNDAPAAWFKEFASFVTSTGWTQSKLDQCLFALRDPHDPCKLVALMGVHVDDTALGGDVNHRLFQSALSKLRSRFPHRKWRVKEGDLAVHGTYSGMICPFT